MAGSSATLATSSDPPWPPDLCVVNRFSDLQSGTHVFGSILHPEVPSDSVAAPVTVAAASSLSLRIDSRISADLTISPSPALWVSKLKSTSHNLKKMASPTFTADGTPTVQAPESVIFKSSVNWKGYLVAQFHGNAPSPTKIFSDLNPIWGKQGRIRVRHHSKNVCLIFIPCELTRRWVLDVAFWHSGKCAFSVSEWSPTLNLAPMKLEYAPVWVLFRNVPVELWSIEGFSTIATGVGFPVQSEYPKLKPYSNGIVKLKVIVKLEGKKACSVKVVDKLKTTVTVSAEYLNLPHKCQICSNFGHSEQRCPDKNSTENLTTPGLGGPIFSAPSSPYESAAPKKDFPSSSTALPASLRKNHQNEVLSPGVAAESSSRISNKGRPSSKDKCGSPCNNQHKETLSPGVAAESSSNTSNQGRPPLRKSNSLPTLNLPSLPSKSAGHLAWIPVGRKTSPRRSPPRSSSSDSVKILSSSQFDSEEELISAAQQIIRKRMEAEDADFPPFSTAKERKKLSRMKQRQAMVQLCESPVAIAGSTASILQENSNTQMVISVEPSVKGLAPIFPEA